jgi:ribosomal protein S17
MKKLFLFGGLILAFTCGRGLAASPAAPAAAAKSGGLDGKVVETMNAASYTYVLIDTGAKKVWAAAPQFAVKVGDAVTVADAMPMVNYQSKTLNRTFEVVYFSGSVAVNGAPVSPMAAPAAAAELPKGHPPTDAVATAPATPDLSGIKRAANGQTVAEIYGGKAKLADKPVAVRGRVVKFNAMIMGKNWLHVRDGSGAEGTNDLTVTTATKVKVGDLVLVTGVLKTDRDFGGGYKYSLIVEDATVVVE